ncbi:MAG: amidohydrolase family protein [Synergistaceae bacterium]|nr:amidohydrolase family protein [Synergistaceae bacterium]
MGYKFFKNANLIDGNGGDVRENVSVLVEDDRIKEISDSQSAPSYADEVIDCAGNTLMPGLIDAHLHLGLVEIEVINLARRNAPGLMAARMFKNLKESLDQGYTSARDTGGADAGFREAQAQGLVPGPRLKVCGSVIAQTGGHGDDRVSSETRPYSEPYLGFRATIADGVPEVLKAARENIRRGADFLKVMCGGGCASPTQGPETSQYTLDELKAVVNVAESVGTYVASHSYSNRSICLSANAGIRTIEHANLMTKETAKLVASKGSFIIPTQITYEVVIEKSRDLVSKFIYDKFVAVCERGYDAIRNAMEAGIPIGGGTDLTGGNTIYASGAVAYQAKAMGPMGALVAFTKTNAKVLGIENETGTIEPGKLADILVVKGDPLKDIELFKNHQDNMLIIMQGGKFHKNLLA